MDTLVQVELQSVRADPESGWHAIVLREKEGIRYLGMWASQSEARAVFAAYQARYLVSEELYLFVWKMRWCFGLPKIPRYPFWDTTGFWERLHIAMGSAIEQATVTGLLGNVYLANLTLRASVRKDPLRLLPSHALVLAIGHGKPVYVSARVMHKMTAAQMEQLDISIEDVAENEDPTKQEE